MADQVSITVIEAARRASIGRSAIYQAISRGDIRPRKLGKRTLIVVAELDRWIMDLPTFKRPAVAQK